MSGRTLTISAHTVAHSQLTITVQVVTTTVLVTGKGTHRKRVTQTHVLYRVSAKGAADTHGRFTAHLHITYKPSKAVPAQVLVTTHKGHLTVTRRTTITIKPAPHSK